MDRYSPESGPCFSTWTVGYSCGQAAWLPGCLAAWLPGCLAAWLPGCLVLVLMVAAFALGRPDVFLRVLVECRFAAFRAEVVGLTVVSRCTSSTLLVYIHAAHRVFRHQCYLLMNLERFTRRASAT